MSLMLMAITGHVWGDRVEVRVDIHLKLACHESPQKAGEHPKLTNMLTDLASPPRTRRGKTHATAKPTPWKPTSRAGNST